MTPIPDHWIAAAFIVSAAIVAWFVIGIFIAKQSQE